LGIALAVASQDLKSSVRWPPIHENVLDAGLTLAQDTFNTPLELLFPVKNRGDYTQHRHRR
jgi:hypothetical protein